MHLSRRDMLAALAASPFAQAMAGQAWAAGPVSRSALPAPSGRLFGTAIQPAQLARGTPLETSIRRDCQLLVPEFHGQWSAVEWIRGQPYHGNYDAIVAYARTTGKEVRGHALIWEEMTPDWARREMTETRDWVTVKRHFATLLARYRGKIGEWIVVNEMIDTESDDRDLRRNSFQQAYGNDYIARALETAREIDSEAKLMINDYSLSQDNPVDAARRTAMLRLVESLKNRGVPIDSVGMQGHIELAKGPIAQKEVAAFMAELAAMGVDIGITELDVLEADRNISLERRDREVADAVQCLLEVACDQPAVKSIVTWGLSDRDSWLQDREHATRTAQICSPVDCLSLNRGLPYDGNMRPKPMRGVLERMMAA